MRSHEQYCYSWFGMEVIGICVLFASMQVWRIINIQPIQNDKIWKTAIEFKIWENMWEKGEHAFVPSFIDLFHWNKQTIPFTMSQTTAASTFNPIHYDFTITMIRWTCLRMPMHFWRRYKTVAKFQPKKIENKKRQENEKCKQFDKKWLRYVNCIDSKTDRLIMVTKEACTWMWKIKSKQPMWNMRNRIDRLMGIWFVRNSIIRVLSASVVVSIIAVVDVWCLPYTKCRFIQCSMQSFTMNSIMVYTIYRNTFLMCVKVRHITALVQPVPSQRRTCLWIMPNAKMACSYCLPSCKHVSSSFPFHSGKLFITWSSGLFNWSHYYIRGQLKQVAAHASQSRSSTI